MHGWCIFWLKSERKVVGSKAQYKNWESFDLTSYRRIEALQLYYCPEVIVTSFQKSRKRTCLN
ncbi:MAG: hypothetical protein CMN21_24360 [Rubinisphaera sp.]|nr:hypothetical protein [Rubinisphaera sp.]